MIKVKATREGLIGQRTSTGFVISNDVPFVALPSTAALRLWVKLYDPVTQKFCRALVLDVGPWNETDHGYVFQAATTNKIGLTPPTIAIRPQAESGVDTFKRKTNGAGIDLGECVRLLLGIAPGDDNVEVLWEFD